MHAAYAAEAGDTLNRAFSFCCASRLGERLPFPLTVIFVRAMDKVSDSRVSARALLHVGDELKSLVPSTCTRAHSSDADASLYLISAYTEASVRSHTINPGGSARVASRGAITSIVAFCDSTTFAARHFVPCRERIWCPTKSERSWKDQVKLATT